MKKLFAIVALVAACTFGVTSAVMAQEDVVATEQVDTAAVDTAAVDTAAAEAETEAVLLWRKRVKVFLRH